MTIVTNENFADIIMAKIEQLDLNIIQDSYRIIINIFICDDKCVIQLFGIPKSETFVLAGNLNPLYVSKLIEKIRKFAILNKTIFNDKTAGFKFMNAVGNISVSLNVEPRSFGYGMDKFLSIRDLLKEYYKGEAEISLENYNIDSFDISSMNKGEMLELISYLSDDEIHNILNFLPLERLEMLRRRMMLSDSEFGRK